MAKWSLNAKTQTPPHSPQGHEHGRNDVMMGGGQGGGNKLISLIRKNSLQVKR